MIWSSRNKSIHKGRQYRGLDIAEGVQRYLRELEGLEFKQITRFVVVESWTPPLDSSVRINFDASYCQDLDRSGSGIVVRSPMGEILATKQTLHRGVASPFAAEGLACLEAVRVGANLGFQTVSIEGDARSIIIKSRSKLRDKSKIAAIIYGSHKQKMFFQSIKFIHIPRTNNNITHNLAAECLRMEKNTYLYGDGSKISLDGLRRYRPREPG